MNLEERREQWERNSIVIAETQLDEGTFLVILKRKRYNGRPYFCHRYFKIGNDWDVSVDASDVDDETVMKWVWEPKAIRKIV